jgi:hypothetical protein
MREEASPGARSHIDAHLSQHFLDRPDWQEEPSGDLWEFDETIFLVESDSSVILGIDHDPPRSYLSAKAKASPKRIHQQGLSQASTGGLRASSRPSDEGGWHLFLFCQFARKLFGTVSSATEYCDKA